jgi:glutaredoxin
VPSSAPLRCPRRLTIILAPWCPHCVPLSVVRGKRLAKQLNVPLRLLDIDRRAQEKAADRMVRQHGDAAPDYLIPQVFLEWSDGDVQHLLTGFSEQVARTDRAWRDLFGSAWLRSVRRGVEG